MEALGRRGGERGAGGNLDRINRINRINGRDRMEESESLF